MTGPAEAVFDGVVAPSLFDEDEALLQVTALPSAPAVAAPPSAPAESGAAPLDGAIDCATACVHGCLRPEACPSAEARARVTALLEGRSLDDLVALAGESLESRTRGRLSRDAPAP
jgi:diaminopimelate epimerase